MTRSLARRSLTRSLVWIPFELLVFIAPCLKCEQSTSPTTPHPTAHAAPVSNAAYDVASIRKSKPDRWGMMDYISTDPDGLTGTRIRIMSLVCLAYGVSDYQVIGGPGWTFSDEYDVHAKMDESTMDMLRTLSPEQLRQTRQHMVQALLADRFNLTVHWETKQFQIYSLVVAKGGPKFHESKPEDSYMAGHAGGKDMMRIRGRPEGFMISAHGNSMDNFASMLSSQIHSKVQNDTGLWGSYDYTLRYLPEDSRLAIPSPYGAGDNRLPDDSEVSVSAALQEQLGLRLDPQKKSVDVVVIDHIEQPSAN